MNLTCTLKRVRFGATSDLNFFEAKNWATWRQWVNAKEWLSSIDSGPRANFNMPVSFHKHISSEKSTLMIGLGLYKFGCQNVPVSSRLLYIVCVHAQVSHKQYLLDMHVHCTRNKRPSRTYTYTRRSHLPLRSFPPDDAEILWSLTPGQG